jgi:hypothetical protein
VELLCPLLDAGVGWLTLRFRCATGRANYFFIIVVVIRYDTAASTRWTLVFIVRAFINYTITVTVWTARRKGFEPLTPDSKSAELKSPERPIN